MQKSMQTLYSVAAERKLIRRASQVARMLGVSHQTLKNWELRGISKDGAIRAQDVFGCDASLLISQNEPYQDHSRAGFYKIDKPRQEQQYAAIQHHLNLPAYENFVAYTATPTKAIDWPFVHITPKQWATLTMADRMLIESLAQRYIGTGAPEKQPAPANTAPAEKLA